MKGSIEKRVCDEANYILATKGTIREIAKKVGVSKSTVHKDLQERLKKYDLNIYNKVNEILKFHYKIRHIRGGESTKKKYAKTIPQEGII